MIQTARHPEMEAIQRRVPEEPQVAKPIEVMSHLVPVLPASGSPERRQLWSVRSESESELTQSRLPIEDEEEGQKPERIRHRSGLVDPSPSEKNRIHTPQVGASE